MLGSFDPVDLEDQISVNGAEVELLSGHQSEFFSEESVDLAYVVVDQRWPRLEVTEANQSAYESKDRHMTLKIGESLIS